MAKRDPNRGKRQIKIDFSSEENLRRFKDFCDEIGVSYSQMIEALSEWGIAQIRQGLFDIDSIRKYRWYENALFGNYKFTYLEWFTVLKHYDNTCLCCGIRGEYTKKGKLSPDHVIPLSKDGPDIIDNIQPLCWPCNHRKRAKTTDYRPQPIPDFKKLAKDFDPFTKD